MLLWNICIPYISSVRELQTDFRQKLWSPAKNTECKTKRLSHKIKLPHIVFLYNEWTLYLTENINEPAIDSTSACHNAVTGELWEKKNDQNSLKMSQNKKHAAARGICARPDTLFLSCSMPKSAQRCSTNMSVSTKDSGSSSSCTRSLAVSLPWTASQW